MRSKFYLAIAVAVALSAQNAIAEYQTKSHYSKNYRCVVEESGGYNHANNKHNLVRFRDRGDYFLTHISRLPIGTIKNMRAKPIVDSFNGDEAKLREDVENVYLKIADESHGISYREVGSYYYREASQDPLSHIAQLYSCETITMEEDRSGHDILCNTLTGGRLIYSTKTGRFMVSSPGFWFLATDGRPDSSIFEFGTCQEYYN